MPNLSAQEWDARAAGHRTPWPWCSTDQCVEVTDKGERVEFRSTISPARGMVSYDRAEVAQFVADVKAGRYDQYLASLPAVV